MHPNLSILAATTAILTALGVTVSLVRRSRSAALERRGTVYRRTWDVLVGDVLLCLFVGISVVSVVLVGLYFGWPR